jgi:hypothetical protein
VNFTEQLAISQTRLLKFSPEHLSRLISLLAVEALGQPPVARRPTSQEPTTSPPFPPSRACIRVALFADS